MSISSPKQDGQQALVAVALDDGKPMFWGRVEYCDGGYLGIRRADTGDVQEGPMELTKIETE
jgi:hypothetical protein